MREDIKTRIDMINKGQVPDGYKKATVGIIPKEWNINSLKEGIVNLDSGVSVNSDTGKVSRQHYGVLKVGCVANGKFKPEESKIIKNSEISRAKCNPKKGCFIVSRANTPEFVGAVGYVEKDYHNLFLSDKLWQIECNDKLNSKWAVNTLSLDKKRKEISYLATGTSKSMQNISKENFTNIKIPMPSYCEQTEIVEGISIWDKYIELKERLIELKKQEKNEIFKKILGRKISNSTRQSLRYYLEEVKYKNKDNRENTILSVNNKKGFILQEEQFDRIVASDNLSNYKIVRKNQFAYNPSRINVGSIDLLRSCESGILSPMYVVFKCKNGLLEEYLYYYLKSSMFLNRVPKLLQGSVRDSLSFESLCSISIYIPDIDEQKKSVKILSTVENEIKLLERELEAIKEQKKSLMQLLLTGIVRV